MILFKNKEQQQPEWLEQVQDTKNRCFVFLEKLEAKIIELSETAIPELKEIYASDDDIYKRTYQQVLSGINGQLGNIRQKANDMYDEKIRNVYDEISDEISISSPYYEILSKFRDECSDRFYIQFENIYQHWHESINKTNQEDLEAKYQNILDEYETIKNKFNCAQCGGNIAIEKIFFISTYIACPHCQTQNTFEPSTEARGLQYFAQSLAEQRTAHHFEAYAIENAKERELYHKIHEIHLSTINEKDKKVLAQKRELEKELEKQRQQVIKNAPQLYEHYLRAMFDEWNKIIPDFAEHNECLYQTQLKQHRAKN